MSAFLYRLGHWCARHPKRVVGAWVLVAIGLFAVNAGLGGETEEEFTVPGVESQAALDLLEERFPAQAGVQGRVVFHAESGRIDQGANAEAIDTALTRIAGGEDIATVGEPVVSQDGQTAFADVSYLVDPIAVAHFDAVDAALEPARDVGVQSEVSGDISEVAKKIEGNDKVGLLVAAIVLIIAFGSVVAAGCANRYRAHRHRRRHVERRHPVRRSRVCPKLRRCSA